MGNLTDKIKQLYPVKKLMPLLRGVKAAVKDISTVPYFMKASLKHTGHNGKIRVVFLCQYVPAWNKFKSLYDIMKKDKRFRPVIVCIPIDMHDHRLDDPNNTVNDTYEYFVKNGYDAVNALTGVESWLELKSLSPDYVVYTRPYNSYLPEEYASYNVKKYARICSLMYAITMTKELYDTTINDSFYKDVYVYFAETNYSVKFYRRKYPVTTSLGIKKCYFYGMPALEQILLDKGTHGHSWDFSQNTFRVMWTPRWTTDPKLGGSNFFVYYQSILDYASKHADMDFLIRPHPLTFENFLRTGEMTEEQVQAYKDEIAAMDNASLDSEKEYDATIWESSVLLSDISGFMPEYFVTGKPIIFCASNMYVHPVEHTRKMLEGCYIANTPEEAYGYLEQLKNGTDPLKEKRRHLIKEVFGKDLGQASAKIVEKMAR